MQGLLCLQLRGDFPLANLVPLGASNPPKVFSQVLAQGLFPDVGHPTAPAINPPLLQLPHICNPSPATQLLPLREQNTAASNGHTPCDRHGLCAWVQGTGVDRMCPSRDAGHLPFGPVMDALLVTPKGVGGPI